MFSTKTKTTHRMKKQTLEDEELVLRRYFGCALAIVGEIGHTTPFRVSSQFTPTEVKGLGRK